MSLQSISLLLGAVGTALAIGNQAQRWLERRRAGTAEEIRLDVDGLTTLMREQRAELEDERKLRREATERIAVLEAEVTDLKRQVRHYEDTIDRLKLAKEVGR